MWNGYHFNNRGRCDGLLVKIITDKKDADYGDIKLCVMFEGKNKNAVSWPRLTDEQLWEQADSHKNNDGELWVIGLIDFELCVFTFNVVDYYDRGRFEHFSPLNLNNYTI